MTHGIRISLSNIPKSRDATLCRTSDLPTTHLLPHRFDGSRPMSGRIFQIGLACLRHPKNHDLQTLACGGLDRQTRSPNRRAAQVLAYQMPHRPQRAALEQQKQRVRQMRIRRVGARHPSNRPAGRCRGLALPMLVLEMASQLPLLVPKPKSYIASGYLLVWHQPIDPRLGYFHVVWLPTLTIPPCTAHCARPYATRKKVRELLPRGPE